MLAISIYMITIFLWYVYLCINIYYPELDICNVHNPILRCCQYPVVYEIGLWIYYDSVMEMHDQYL